MTSSRKSLSVPALIGCAVTVGILAGAGAAIFRSLINLMHNLFFFGEFSFFYTTDLHTLPSVWGAGIIFAPVLGGLVVTWLIENVSHEAKGHGVSEVMYANHFHGGRIRPVVAFGKALTSAISIGSGGSVGREGPIIQIGSALGSAIGQIIAMPAAQRTMLVAAGGAAGLAATFNAPLGGLLFALELLLVSVNETSISLVTISTVVATFIGYFLFGMDPVLLVTPLPPLDYLSIFRMTLFFIPFGIFLGLASALFIYLLCGLDDLFHAVFKNPYLRHSIGMFIVGVMFYLCMVFLGHYYIEGLGYALIFDTLKELLVNPWVLSFLFFSKLLATCLTLGSGGTGGVFLPSLVLGAVFGAAYGQFFNALFPNVAIDASLFAVAGMAGMVGGTTGAVITAIVIVMEMTHDFYHILPTMLTVAIAYSVRAAVCQESIYTLRLFRRGVLLPRGLKADISRPV